MFLVVLQIVGIDQDVIKINDNINVQKIVKNFIHESLKGG